MASAWNEVMLTLARLAPVRVESEPHGGQKFIIVSSGGAIVCKVTSNRRADRAVADAIAASINATARALHQSAAS